MSVNRKVLYIIYDGDCPFCSRCATAMRIKKVVDEVKLINARTDNYQHLLKKHKFNLNKGMLVILDDKYYYGPEAAQMLALLSSPVDIFNKLNYWLFHRLFFARIFYPFFRFLRGIALKIKGVPPLS